MVPKSPFAFPGETARSLARAQAVLLPSLARKDWRRGPGSKRVHLLWIGVGTNEPERMKSGLESLHTSLDEGKIQHIFYESPGTDHEWQTWRRDLNDFAPRLFQSAAQSSAAGR
jgi:hypothetical protein